MGSQLPRGLWASCLRSYFTGLPPLRPQLHFTLAIRLTNLHATVRTAVTADLPSHLLLHLSTTRVVALLPRPQISASLSSRVREARFVALRESTNSKASLSFLSSKKLSLKAGSVRMRQRRRESFKCGPTRWRIVVNAWLLWCMPDLQSSCQVAHTLTYACIFSSSFAQTTGWA